MRFERVINKEHRMYEKAMELYGNSFPSHEQRKTPSQLKILSDDEYYFGLIYDNDVFVGLMLYWETEKFIYVEHFCILPEMRSKGYGQKALDMLTENRKTVILEIDPPADEISVRRKGFYERCGFAENSYSHVHPPYRRENSGHDLVIMSYPEKIEKAEYEDFRNYLADRVMKDVF